MKKQLAVLFGGASSEYEVSLQSAAAVLEGIDHKKYEVLMVGITREGDWYRFFGPTAKVADGSWAASGEKYKVALSPDRATHGLLEFQPDGFKAVRLDAAFPVLHGKNGEDGTVQGLLQLAGIPVVGCGMAASALCMDKVLSHTAVAAAGIPVAQKRVYSPGDDLEAVMYSAASIGFPLFVKPVRAGSSFGVSCVRTANELAGAVQEALQYDDRVLIEERIEGIEVGCSIIGEEDLLVGEVDEIEIAGDTFDFHEKYTLETSRIHLPARIADAEAQRVKETGKRIYRALGCSGFARVDMFYTPKGDIYFNEVNTIPGFTAHSRFPNMFAAAGLPFGQMVDKLIERAMEE